MFPWFRKWFGRVRPPALVWECGSDDAGPCWWTQHGDLTLYLIPGVAGDRVVYRFQVLRHDGLFLVDTSAGRSRREATAFAERWLARHLEATRPRSAPPDPPGS